MVIRSIGATGGGGSVTSSELSNVLSAHDALSTTVSNIISSGGGGVSVTSNELSNAFSVLVDTDLSNAFSDLLSVISIGFSNVTSAKDVVSNALSNETSNRTSADAALSGRIDTASALGTTADVHASAASAAATSADAHANTVSAAAAAADVHASAASAAATSIEAALSATINVVSNALSAEIVNRVSADNALSNAISALSSFVVPTYYFPKSMSVTGGTLVSGTVADLSAVGGGDVLVSELAATPGFLLTTNFSIASAVPNIVQAHALYEGGAGHTVNMDIFNHVTSSWTTLGQIPDTAVIGFQQYALTGATDYVSATVAKVRMNHISAGNPTHSFLLDYLTLAHLLDATETVDHGALQGLLDDDHTQYALADGTRGFSAISARVDTASALATTADTHASTASAAATTADVHASAASAAATSVDGRLNSVISTLISAADAHASVASVAAASVDGHVNTVSAAVNTVSNNLSALCAAISAVSTVSAAGVAIGLQSVINALSVRIAGVGAGSVTSAEVQTASAAATSVDSRLTSVTSAIINASTGGSLAAISLMSDTKSAVANVSTVSAAGTAVGLQSVVNALSVRIAGVGAGSVTSAEVQTASAAATSVDARVTSVAAKTQVRTRAAVSVISGNALTDVIGLSLAVSAGGMYAVDGTVMFEKATSGGVAFGFSTPAPLATVGLWFDFAVAVTIAQAAAIGAVAVYSWGRVVQSAVAANNTAVVSASVLAVNAIRYCQFRGMLGVSNTGTFQIMARGSVANDSLSVLGGYIRAYKLN